MAKKEPLCTLNSQLWVPTDLVSREAVEDFTYTFDKVEYQPQVGLPRMCMNCDLWGKKWRPGKTTCESKGYRVDDLCKKFVHKSTPTHIETILRTYKHRPDGWSVFARGDLAKIKKHFGKLGIEDQRSAPKLPFDLVCHRELYPEQVEVVEQWLKHKYGIIKAPTGFGKCLGKGTPILMYDGTIKPVEEVQAGELLMGPDSKARRVLSTCTGREPLYRVTPSKGDPYIVNESHILSLKITKSKKSEKVELLNISVRDYLGRSNWFKHRAKGWRAPVDFPSSEPLPPDLPPYLLGLWLGDGSSRVPAITTQDPEIVDTLEHYAAERGMHVRRECCGGRCPTYHVTTGIKGSTPNSLLNALRSLGLLNNKHVPHAYLTSTREDRLQLLAGLLDSDGHRKAGGGYDVVFKPEALSDALCFLARSLGFAAYKKECLKTCTNNGKVGKYYRVIISGDCCQIPCRLPRKKWKSPRKQKKNPLVTGIRVEPIGEGDYFGFEIDGPDRLFLLGDFTVTHNTVMWAWLIAHLNLKTLLLAQEVRHLMVGFEGMYEHTNIGELEKEAGEHLMGVLGKDWEWRTDGKDKYRHFLNRPGKVYPITFSTFQALASKKGKKLRKKLKNDFGVVWQEESHHSSAKTFYKAARSFNPRYRGGQTATPTRKDKTHVAIYDLVGPVTAIGTKEQMIPEVHFHASNILVPDSVFRRQYVMPILVNYLASNSAYQELVFETIMEDMEKDRKVLVITERKNHAFRLKQRLELEGFGCELMMGGMKLKEQNWYAEKLLSGEISVIIGTSVINENVNIPPWDSIHQPFPNFGKEREEQRVGRIRRYLSGTNKKFLKDKDIEWEKPQPLVHVYTWHSSNNMAEKAINFRKNLYKSWNFDFAATAESESKKKRMPKTMKDWLKEFESD